MPHYLTARQVINIINYNVFNSFNKQIFQVCCWMLGRRYSSRAGALLGACCYTSQTYKANYDLSIVVFCYLVLAGGLIICVAWRLTFVPISFPFVIRSSSDSSVHTETVPCSVTPPFESTVGCRFAMALTCSFNVGDQRLCYVVMLVRLTLILMLTSVVVVAVAAAMIRWRAFGRLNSLISY